MIFQFIEKSRFFGIYKKTTNTTCVAGNVKLFGKVVYSFSRIQEDWGLVRRWHLLFMTIVHLGNGYTYKKPGWYFFFPKLKIKLIKPDNGYGIN